MRPALESARVETVRTLGKAPFLNAWTFEYTPGSSEQVEKGYLRKVREADIVIWLVGEETTNPVINEIHEAISSGRRLLVMKLPADKRADNTQDLLAKVNTRAKICDVSKAENLHKAIELTLGDEIIRAIRNKPSIGPFDLLEEMGRASRARCIMRWQAIGVPWETAAELADNMSIGGPGPEMIPSPGNPIKILIGEFGIGKSLIAERLLQVAIKMGREDGNAPVPVYIEANSEEVNLINAIEKAVKGFTNHRTQGVTVIIDGADVAGTGAAIKLLNEARVLVGSWPKTTVVITTRPIPALAKTEEVVSVPMLSEDQANELVGRFAGRPISSMMVYGWPESVKDAIRRPLFAILLGFYLRGHDMLVPRSTGELLSHLVEQALTSGNADLDRSNQLLMKLATLSTDKGGLPVLSVEVGSMDELRPLFESGLVIESSGTISFPLPILTQWFAAQSLSAGNPKAEELMRDPNRIENWKYPLIIFSGTFSHEHISRILIPFVETYPGLAAEIITEGLAGWGMREDAPPPPYFECGHRIRTTMTSWTKGIGPLAQLIAPVKEDGSLLPIGTYVDGSQLITGWYRGKDAMADIVQLPSIQDIFRNIESGWSYKGIHPGRQSGWAWRMTFDDLIDKLKDILHSRKLPIEEGPLALEKLWLMVLAIARKGQLYNGSIPIRDIEHELIKYGDNCTLIINSQRIDLPWLKRVIIHRRELGEEYIQPPWPGPDKGFGGGWLWESYTDEQMLARTKAVLWGAIEGYQQIVDKWFSRLAPRLQTAVTMPARLVGVLYSPRRSGRMLEGPALKWYLEALPRGSNSYIDINIGEDVIKTNILQSSMDKLRTLRPEAASWIGTSLHNQVLGVFQTDSATEITYAWLWDDLRRISWVK